MKKILLVLLSLLALTSCARENTESEIFKETVKDLPDKFTYVKGMSLRGDLYVEYSQLKRGEEFTIVNEDDDYYYIDVNGLVLAVKKEFIRTSGEEAFKEYEGYTRNGATLYKDFNLTEVITSFELNDIVKIIDKCKNIFLVEYNGETAYMESGSVSSTKIQIYVAPKIEYQESSGGGSSSGGGGGDNPSPPPADPPTSGDGEDISLYIPRHEVRLLSSNNNEKGSVKVDGTSTYLAVLNRGDTVKVLSETDDSYVILISGRSASVEKKYVRLDSESAYEEWEGYAYGGAAVYKDFNLTNRVTSYAVNTRIKVIDEVDGKYIVDLGNGDFGYMLISNISKTEIKVYVAPKIEYQESTGGESSGGGGGAPVTPAPEPEPEWTDPVL